VNNSIFPQTQSLNSRVLLDRVILSNLVDVPSEATKFLLAPKEYARKHELQISEQALNNLESVAYHYIPDECAVLLSRNPFKQGIREQYRPDISPVVTMSAAAAAALGAAAAALVGGLAFAATAKK